MSDEQPYYACDPSDLTTFPPGYFSEMYFVYPSLMQQPESRGGSSPPPSATTQDSPNQPSPTSFAPGSSRTSAPTSAGTGPSPEQEPPRTHENAKHAKRPRGDDSSGRWSSAEPDSQRPKHSHQGEEEDGPARTQEPASTPQDPAPQNPQPPQPHLKDTGSDHGAPAPMGVPAGSGYVPQTQGESSAQSGSAPVVIDLTESPPPVVNPAAQPPGAGQGTGQEIKMLSVADEEWEAVVEWIDGGNTFKVDEQRYKYSHWSRNHEFQLRVLAASFATWAEATKLGQRCPGLRTMVACMQHWRLMDRRRWTEEEDERLLSYVEDYPSMDETQRDQRKALLIQWMAGKNRSEAKCQGRLKMFTRWGRSIKGKNIGGVKT